MSEQVLIVGAGPVGLTLAAYLSHYGIKSRIIDKNSHATQTSNAVGIHVRTLELLETIGLTDSVVEKSRHMRAVKFFTKQKLLAEFDFSKLDNVHNYICCLPQSETEALLNEHLAQKGITVERNVTLTKFKTNSDTVTVHLQHQNKEEVLEYNWLLACDGYHSTVREALKIPYEGEDMNLHFLMIDAPVTWTESLDDMSIAAGHHISLAMFPMKKSVRIIAEVSHSEQYKNAEPDEKVFMAMARESFPGTMTIEKPLWASKFWIHERLAEHYRVGHVMLLGDAAHAHSPAGGQGMNTGMQDAINLSWKLANVIKGTAKEQILDSYGIERRSVAEHVINMSSRTTKIGIQYNPFVTWMRDHLAPLLTKLQIVQEKMIHSISELSINYHQGPLSKGKAMGGLTPGDRAPLKVLPNPDGQYLLLDFTGDGAALIAEQNLQKCVKMYPLQKKAGETDYFSAIKTGYCLIRPDYYIAYIGTDKDQLIQYISNL